VAAPKTFIWGLYSPAGLGKEVPQ